MKEGFLGTPEPGKFIGGTILCILKHKQIVLTESSNQGTRVIKDAISV